MSNKIFLILFVFILSLAGCSGDYLDIVPDNTATMEMAFHDAYNAKRFLYTCYSSMPNHGARGNNPALDGGDEIWFNQYVNDNAFWIAKGYQNTNDPYVNYWNGTKGGKKLYAGIRNCNIFLENVDKVSVELTDKELARWKAEAKFLKAYYHWYLIRMYGPIVINDENLPVSADTEEMLAERQPVDQCFMYVIDLLDEATPDLPLLINNTTTELGRITQPVAKALKARVMVNYASPLFNGNPDLKTLINNDGTKLFDSQYSEQRWADAATACQEAIDLAHSADHRLYQMEDYQTKFTISDSTRRRAVLRSAVSERWNPEIVWGNSLSTINKALQKMIQPRFQTSNDAISYTSFDITQNYSATFRTAEMFYSDNGVPINEDINWDYENRFELSTITEADRYYLKPDEETVNLHFHREPRFYSSLAFDRGAWYGNGRVSDDAYPWYVEGRAGEQASAADKATYSITGYWPKKLIHMENEIVENNGSYTVINYPFPVIRLADLYLLYAEALNESGNTTAAHEWIDKVRERAGLEGVVDSWTKYTNNAGKPAEKDGLRDIIQHERLIELAFEGRRFWDLRRWKRAVEFMNDKPLRGWNTSGGSDAESFYKLVTIQVQEFNTRDYLWPMKESEMSINPYLIQNLGW